MEPLNEDMHDQLHVEKNLSSSARAEDIRAPTDEARLYL